MNGKRGKCGEGRVRQLTQQIQATILDKDDHDILKDHISEMTKRHICQRSGRVCTTKVHSFFKINPTQILPLAHHS